MNKEKLSYIRDVCIVSVVISAALIVGVKVLLPAVLPFLIAWATAFVLRRPADFLASKIRVNKKIVRPCIAVIIIVLLIGGAVFACVRIAIEAWDLFTALSGDGTLSKIIEYFAAPIEQMTEKFGIAPELSERIADAISGMLSSLLSSAAGVITSVAGAVPGIILFIIVTAISVAYFAIDLENVNKRVHNLLPSYIDKGLVNFKNRFLNVIIKYIRSYALIMLITFLVMLVGLSALGVRYSLLLALIIAVLDLLPVIGIGIVLIPWGVYMLTVGEQIGLGIGLLVLWGVGSILRQVIEPKIIGKELGIHPLLTLVLMYAGYSLLGFFGLIILPLLSVFISIIPPRSDRKSALGSSESAE